MRDTRLMCVRRLPKALMLLAWLAPCVLCRATETATGWEAVPAILARIQSPKFPTRGFPMRRYGATADGKADCKPAIDKAIAACANAGGGRVVIPAGEWFVRGPIHLKSNVNLHLEKGATVRFSTTPDDYLPIVL